MHKILCKLAGMVLVGAIAVAPGMAISEELPDRLTSEAMVKSTLIALNDANMTGDFSVLRAKASKTLRDRYSSPVMARLFGRFVGPEVDLSIVSALDPVSADAEIDPMGRLNLDGHFDLAQARLSYHLDFTDAGSGWQLVGINVGLTPAAE